MNQFLLLNRCLKGILKEELKEHRMAKKVAESIKHPKDKQVHIPSKVEAGYEDANPKVQQV